MPTKHYEFAVLKLKPDESRGEVVNVGLVLFKPSGVDIRMSPSLAKARALSAYVCVEHLRTLPQSAAPVLDKIARRDLQLMALESLFRPVTIEGDLGVLSADNEDDYEARVQQIMDGYVMPEARVRKRQASYSSRLHTDLRDWFRRAGLLSSGPDSIRENKVVTNYPITPAAGVYAEFAIKNGDYRITETVDFRVKDIDSRKANESAAKAIALIEAKASLGSGTKRYAIVAAQDYLRVQSHINLLARHAEHVLVRDSHEDMAFYANMVAKATHIPHLELLDAELSPRKTRGAKL